MAYLAQFGQFTFNHKKHSLHFVTPIHAGGVDTINPIIFRSAWSLAMFCGSPDAGADV